MNIAAALIRERTSRNLNKTQFARLLEVSKSRITDWEGGRMPRQTRLIKIAKTLHLTIEELLGFGKKRRS